MEQFCFCFNCTRSHVLVQSIRHATCWCAYTSAVPDMHAHAPHVCMSQTCLLRHDRQCGLQAMQICSAGQTDGTGVPASQCIRFHVLMQSIDIRHGI